MGEPRVLIVDDEDLIRWSLAKELARRGSSVSTAETGGEALRAHGADPADIVLLDTKLPDCSGLSLIPEILSMRPETVIVMLTHASTIETAVEATRLGAYDYFTKPFDLAKLLNVIERGLERISLQQENRLLKSRQDGASAAETIVAESPAMQEALALASRVAESDAATVLLIGESGTGKDMLARFIHRSSARRERLFLDSKCAAVSEVILESDLFGHERGAFADAKVRKQGVFELAAGGTVYLDEIAEAPPSVQAKLLRMLEERTFRRVGGVRDISADVRLITATNRDLEEAVGAHHMREDLFYRLNVFPIPIAPLRERSEDILPLATLFLERFRRAMRRSVAGFTPDAEQALIDWTWPGNVHELRNVIERAVILAGRGEPIGPALLSLPRNHDAVALGGDGHDDGGRHHPLADLESRAIRDALAASRGNQSRAAEQLGISRDALRRKLRRLGLAPR